MKNTWLAFVAISCVALVFGRSFALAPAAACQEASFEDQAKTTGDHQVGDPGQAPVAARRRGSNNDQPRRTGQTRISILGRLPNSEAGLTPAHAVNSSRPASSRFAGAAKGASIENQMLKGALPTRPPAVVQPAAPALTNVRHGGANAAVIGGSPNSNNRRTAAINGSDINRKH